MHVETVLWTEVHISSHVFSLRELKIGTHHIVFQHYYGKFCECDDFTCRRHSGLPCSGPDHGICECGKCVCKWGWSGEACECPDSKENCYPPDFSEECMGRGSCECGVCKCKENYSGKYCDECPVSSSAVLTLSVKTLHTPAVCTVCTVLYWVYMWAEHTVDF